MSESEFEPDKRRRNLWAVDDSYKGKRISSTDERSCCGFRGNSEGHYEKNRKYFAARKVKKGFGIFEKKIRGRGRKN